MFREILHEEIVKRSSGLVKFLAAQNSLGDEDVTLILSLRESHESISLEINRLLISTIPVLSEN